MLIGVRTRQTARANSIVIREIETTDSVSITAALLAPTYNINAEIVLDSIV
jgi:hypothetical protein